MSAGEMQDYTFEAFAQHDFYRQVNEQLVDTTLKVREFAGSPIRRVLDLACGTGAVTQLLVDRVREIHEPVEIIGVDSSETALDKARRLVGSAARFVRGTAQAFSDAVAEKVDVVMFCNAIHLLPDKDAVVGEMRKALDSGGVLAFNTSFYDGCYVPGTERFYKLWMLRSMRLLKEHGMRTDRSKVEAMRWLSPDEYSDILRQHQFTVEHMQPEQALMTVESWQDISHYAEFAHGALPGVPLEVAIPVLQRSVEQAYDELGITQLPRNWLQVVARAE
jgi:ubiquinone/menaquinone biosynthesis C-methylase UbiE